MKMQKLKPVAQNGAWFVRKNAHELTQKMMASKRICYENISTAVNN